MISTRGAWLAQEHWPGKLVFLAAGGIGGPLSHLRGGAENRW